MRASASELRCASESNVVLSSARRTMIRFIRSSPGNFAVRTVSCLRHSINISNLFPAFRLARRGGLRLHAGLHSFARFAGWFLDGSIVQVPVHNAVRPEYLRKRIIGLQAELLPACPPCSPVPASGREGRNW